MSEKDAPIIVWFRRDLRIHDNPALYHAAKAGRVVPVYILEDEDAGEWADGAAGRVWLDRALRSLEQSLNGTLRIFAGKAEDILNNLAQETGARGLYWNRCYEPWRVKRDKRIKETMAGKGLDAQSFQASLLWEPWTIKNQSGEPYRVFTPFYKKGCLAAEPPREPLPKADLKALAPAPKGGMTIDGLALVPDMDWPHQMIEGWDISEQGAQDRLSGFLEEGLAHYKDGRNNPADPYVSRLSPYLHWGLISPHQAWHAVRTYAQAHNATRGMEHYCSELGWREFSYSLLYNFPDLPRHNLQDKFDAFPWRSDSNALKAWQKGMTGCPMVDAGMRELWQTGYMHNRVRMVTGSFLVKNLLLHWHHGEDWFWDCLMDADLANNSASWQWVAGCGADAAPYFRIFNPVTQGQKFDPDGRYVRRYVPELANLPDKYIHCPWEAPQEILDKAGVRLGDTYPELIVDLKASRERALEAFESIKKDAA